MSPLTFFAWRNTSRLGVWSPSCSVPPASNQSTTVRLSSDSVAVAKTLATAERTRSRATVSAPFISPSYSSSNFPVIAGSAV